jgi:uncharacterized protein
MKLAIPHTDIADFCRRYHIRRLSLFGSVVRDDFGPESDIDCLVEFEPGHTPGLDIIDVEAEFGKLFGGRRVDMLNPRYVNHRLRHEIFGSAEVIYDKAEDGIQDFIPELIEYLSPIVDRTEDE